MEKTMNFEMLYNELSGKLKNIPGLTKMYIGKASDLDEPTNRHKNEGYSHTVEIAYGNPHTITEGEIYLIKKFKESDFNCMNKNDGGGAEKATKLYVSYDCKPNYESIENLDDDNLDWFVIQLKK